MKRSIFLLASGTALLLLSALVGCGGKPPGSKLTCEPVTPPDGAATILISGGTFTMGSDPGAANAEADEAPAHEITLGCFSIYKNEVTNAQYARCVGEGECLPITPVADTLTERWREAAFADRPVLGVDYNMASAYCAWVGGRLPTEAEWEYAASSSKEILFPWGDDAPDCEKAAFAGCLDPAETVPVGSLALGASPFKLNDLSGNAWEWVLDWYDSAYYSVSPSVSPTGPLTGSLRVVRGGSYESDLHMLRLANRQAGDPYTPYSNAGFRCAFGPITLPEGYDHGVPEYHRPPPDHKNPVDDGTPGNVLVGVHPLDCPPASNKYSFIMTIISADIFTVQSFQVEGAPSVCSMYDQNTHQIDCVVQDPPDTPNPFWNATLTIASGAWQAPQTILLSFGKPQNCDQQQGPEQYWYHVDCPANGIVPIELKFDPAITWTVTENSFGTPFGCIPINANQMTCLAPDVLDNGFYRIHLEGTFNSETYVKNFIFLPPNCTEQHAMANYGCDGGHVIATVSYGPDQIPPDVVKVGNGALNCQWQGPNHEDCIVPDGLQGQPAAEQICYGQVCTNKAVQIPDCSLAHGQVLDTDYSCQGLEAYMLLTYQPANDPPDHVQVGAEVITCQNIAPNVDSCPVPEAYQGLNVVETICYGADCTWNIKAVPVCDPGKTQIEYLPICSGDFPHLLVAWSPSDPEPDAETLNGQQMTCAALNAFQELCLIEGFQPNENADASVCIGSTCNDQVIAVPDCKKPYACRLSNMECTGETSISFMVDVVDGDGNPVEFVPGSLAGGSGLTTYACGSVPNVDGRAYCAGAHPQPVTEGFTLKFTQLLVGAGSCSIDLNTWLAALPGCNTPPPEISCPSITDQGSCEAANCQWVTGGAPGQCVNK